MPYTFDHSAEYQLLPGLRHHSRIDLGPTRTPLQPAQRLGDELGIELYIKRDDSQPLGMGGNKIRQLEFYLGPAGDLKADTILITGAVQSNFVRLCAAACRKLGLHPVVQLEDRVPTNDPLYQSSGNVLLDQLYGAEIHHLSVGEDEALADASLDKLAHKLKQTGSNPYVIHLGVNDPPLGALGYALAAAELKLQCESIGVAPDHIVVPSGSGVTHAGIVSGVDALDWTTDVHGICVRREASLQLPRIEKRAAEVSSLLQLPEPPSGSVIVHDHVLSPGYGQLNSEVNNAIHKAAHLEGLIVDPVYSGRTLAGLIELVKRGTITKGESVIFLHTGGTPAIFAYQNKLELS